MSSFLTAFLFVAALTSTAFGQTNHSDLIKSLPGEPHPGVAAKQYSGYLKISDNKSLHYWFIESNQEEDYPFILWLTGGPGCSSLDALLSQTGPYLVSDDGNLTVNPYSWSQFANVLYLEAPAGVGFSFSRNVPTHYNDSEIVGDIIHGLHIFLKNHSEHRNNPFYIFAEGYASVQGIPLAKHLLSDWEIRLAGLIIEGGHIDRKENMNSIIDYAYYHGAIGLSLWDSLHEYCCDNETGKCSYYESNSSNCMDYVTSVQETLDQLNLYDYLDYCKLPPHLEVEKLQAGFSHLHCINQTAETVYLNRIDVKRAIHVNEDFVSQWTPCSETVSGLYQYSNKSYLSNITQLAQETRIAFVTGTEDMVFNYLGTQNSIESLNLRISSAWKYWLHNDAIAGFSTVYNESLSLFTVNGAGHYVARSQAGPLKSLVEAFVGGK
ncbi:lysosomal protective protein-like isoform X2 [Oscarella lobularis]|uniref:lysosomal protective protein-like isoform X2 n=1 Tax=Oscarella lobularis TaxID=121494 RepID=UPI003314220F